MAKTWTEEEIVELLEKSNKAVDRAVVAIFNRQTQDEKVVEDTKHCNSIGFSASDAHRGSYWAKWVLRGKALTGKHLEDARKTMRKYRKQLVDIANAGMKEAL
jgi:hypothetical protein